MCFQPPLSGVGTAKGSVPPAARLQNSSPYDLLGNGGRKTPRGIAEKAEFFTLIFKEKPGLNLRFFNYQV